MSPAVRNRLIAVAALVVAAGGLAFIAFGNLGENLVYYWSPKELLSQGERAYGPTIRLGGLVKAGSIQWNAAHTELQFRVAEGREADAPNVLVRSTEVPPQMFRDNIGVVVEGTYSEAAVFQSNRLMVNHSNEYRAPKEGEQRNWKETVTDASAATSPAAGSSAQTVKP
ncbi:MAG: cytochrome c maturation protein CcmE [Myxococcaceae bacterium]|nr:cytochrome c maturation protein CcmE [Myxococcaceae bacterium]MCI0670328.1 cytochrome c maturation protein CcmE [Myxococcaceae bacterium]